MPQKTRKAKNAAVHEIEDLEALKALSEPMRLRILLLLADESPRTVKEIGAELGLDPSRLYYHVRILAKSGLIRVARKRMVSGIEERSYQATAPTYTPAPSVTAMLGNTGFLRTIFDVVQAQVDLALRQRPGTEIGDPGGAVPIASMTQLSLTTEQVEQIQRKLFEWIEEHQPATPSINSETARYDAFFMLYRNPAELMRDETEESLEQD